MVKLEGNYEFVSETNYLEYLKSFGLSDEQAQKLASIKTPIVIKAVSESSLTVSYADKEVVFPLGKEFEYTLAIGQKIKTVTNVNGNTVTFRSKLNEDGSLTEEKVWTISDSGLTSVSTNSLGKTYSRQYKRV